MSRTWWTTSTGTHSSRSELHLLWFNLPLPFLACCPADSIPPPRLSASALVPATPLPAHQRLCFLCWDTFGAPFFAIIHNIIRSYHIVTIQLPAATLRTCSRARHWCEAYPLAYFATCWQECRLCVADMAAARKVPQPGLPQNLQ